MNRFARANWSIVLHLYLISKNVGGMPKKKLIILEKCVIASFSSLAFNATRAENFYRVDGFKNIDLFSSSMAPRRPKKATKRNISGLRNQKRARSPSPALSQEPGHQSNSQKWPRGNDEHAAESDSEDNWNPCLAADGDSVKIAGYDGMVAVDDSGAEDTDECDEQWEDSLDDETFCEKMISMSSKHSCKDDEDWVPYRLQWLTNKRKEKKCMYALT
jgi:hypothetical protein